jgi:hypothetical protein
MFISAVSASDRIQLQLASPAIINWRRLNPNRNGVKPCRNDGVGLQLRGHVCGPDDVRSELGFDVKVECFSLQIQHRQMCGNVRNKLNILHGHGVHVSA